MTLMTSQDITQIVHGGEGMNEAKIAILGLIICIIALVGFLVTTVMLTKGYRRTIDQQNATIQRLINREPVTYAETGTTLQKPSKEVYAAWGNQMLNIDEDEGRS